MLVVGSGASGLDIALEACRFSGSMLQCITDVESSSKRSQRDPSTKITDLRHEPDERDSEGLPSLSSMTKEA